MYTHLFNESGIFALSSYLWYWSKNKKVPHATMQVNQQGSCKECSSLPSLEVSKKLMERLWKNTMGNGGMAA